ncbi:hypothetical protein LR48_Vigan02g071400 [Vigna angularis]|uniref:Uncharacterized protein n=1 Tax=Phaseolus angularis TaxID=3914 RepID=A0A0L9TWL5_PHAAN|nr:hypothetical protein LR48_Vigan02g071400 [Vigna angularis]
MDNEDNLAVITYELPGRQTNDQRGRQCREKEASKDVLITHSASPLGVFHQKGKNIEEENILRTKNCCGVQILRAAWEAELIDSNCLIILHNRGAYCWIRKLLQTL